MQRHRLRHVLVRIFGSLAIRFVHRVALGRRRQIDRRLRERGVPFRHADEMDGILRGDCDRQRLRVGVADVLGREAHEPPRDVQRILTRFEHPREPVHRRVGIAVAHRLVKRGDEVVMLFSAFVVQQRTPLDRLLDVLNVDVAAATDDRSGRDAELEDVQRGARVAIGVDRHRVQRSIIDCKRLLSVSALRVGDCPAENRLDFLGDEAAQHEDLGARQQRRVDLERWILGRRADEHDVAGFDAGQKRVLLRLVEAMDFVDEDDRSAAGGPSQALGVGHDLADFLDAGQHGAERHEASLRRVRDDAGERRLAGAGRAPENDRLQEIALDGFAQRLAGREQLLLADELVERARAHPLGQRRRRPFPARLVVFEQRAHRRCRCAS